MAGPRESGVLAGARGHGAGGKGAKDDGWGGASGEGGRKWGTCGHGRQLGKCRGCREERADGNTAGQQAGDSDEQGQARF